MTPGPRSPVPSPTHLDLARRACADALALARLQVDRRAWAVVAWPAALPGDPLAAYTAAEGRQRTLLWRGDDWLLGIGEAAALRASGPGCIAVVAQEAARLEGRCIVAAAPGAPALPCLLATLAFEDRPQPGHWGADLPGCRLSLPRRLLWRRGADGWTIAALEIGADDQPVDALAGRLLADPDPVARRAPLPWPDCAADYRMLAEDAIALVRDGAMRKVVLARASDLACAAPPDPGAVFAGLRANADPQTTLYAHDLDDGACFVGATPEVLFEGEGDLITTCALAGSSPRDEDPDQDQVLATALETSTKERKEHQLVVEHIVAALRPRCRPFDLPKAPRLRTLPRLLHLETPIAARFAEPGHTRSRYHELLGALHPTPAVCGLPTATAMHYIHRHERLERGLYAGVLGWSTPDRCSFLVALRGGILRGNAARLFAGAGLVETSDPDAEAAEIDLKLAVMRGVLAQAVDR